MTFYKMSWRQPELEAEGIIRLKNPEGVENLEPVYVYYDKRMFRADFETITVEDSRLRSSWRNQVFRIMLTASQTPLKGEYIIRIKQLEGKK